MIYTVTFNPSIDYIAWVPNFSLGELSRTSKEELYPGGKGINVSMVLAALGISNKAYGFLAGFTGKEIERRLQEMGCSTEFIMLNEGISRINVKIKANQESEMNGQGPNIPPEALNQLFESLTRLKDGDSLVLAGSIPNTLPADIYEKVLEQLKAKNLRIVVDATKDLLKNVLKYRPFLIKPNKEELGELFETQIANREEVILYAKKLQSLGARNVLVSMAGEGAVLVTEEEMVYESESHKGVVINSVGAGDSMIAGFLAGYISSSNYEEAFHLGLAAGSACAFSEWLPSKEKILELYHRDKLCV